MPYCYLRDSTSLAASAVGWAGHHEYAIDMTVPRWTPNAELKLTFPARVHEMRVSKVVWASALGAPTRAESGGAQLTIRLAATRPEPPIVHIQLVSMSFQVGDLPFLESCSGKFPPAPPEPAPAVPNAAATVRCACWIAC